MRVFCEGDDQDFYRRNHLFSLKQSPQKLLLAYDVDPKSVRLEKNHLTGILVLHKAECSESKLYLSMEFYECGAMNMLLEDPAEKRFRASPYVITRETLAPALNITFSRTEEMCTITHRAKMEEKTFESYQTEGECSYVIYLRPFHVEGYYNKNLAFTMNKRQLLNYDFHKSFEELLAKARDSAELSLLLSGWEQFSHGCTIACPKGPQSHVPVSYTHLTLPTICSV
eukprot:TRINITY_DN5617_c0_g1_i7.p1 TRINITY_DN5617_c0_g1~~TRINITY_DN5617_c0_g1_i7.p1  ORF type:complete len:227 (+),score=62.90 TRINITY_DN5617_c0_g1_i7:137-817(+)